MYLPDRPPAPSIVITSPVASLSGSSRRSYLSESEFDATEFRKAVENANRMGFVGKRDEMIYSMNVGRPNSLYRPKSTNQRREEKAKAEICIDIPSPLAQRLFGSPHRSREAIWLDCLAAHYGPESVSPWLQQYNSMQESYETEKDELLEAQISFTIVSLSTVFVFLLLTYVYINGFVKF